MKDFKFHSPNSINEVCDLLKTHKSNAIVLAGGTDLIPSLYHGNKDPEHIINLKRVPGLNEIAFFLLVPVELCL